MPIHKNALRQKKFTFTFNGTYIRRDFEDSSSYLGIAQDIWEAGTYPNLGIAENNLPLRFGGKAGGSFRVETAPDDEDSLIIMCMNETDDAYEYTAEELRDNALAAVQATQGFDNTTGLAYTPTQLGSFDEYDEVYSDYTTNDLIWNPLDSNTLPFADDHPVGTNPVITHFVNVLDTGETFATTFEPTTAVYSSSADEIELVFPEAPSSTALTNKYWAVGKSFGSNTNSTDTAQWTAVVTSRAQDGDVTRVVMKVTSGSAFLNTTALAAPASSGANSIISLFTGGRQFVVYVSVTNLYMVDQVNTANQGYTIEGVCTEVDIAGDVQVGLSTDTFNVLEMNLTTVTDVTSNFYDINNVPDSTMSGETTINRIRFRPNNETSITGGGTFIFINIPTSTGSSPLDKVTVAASILNETTFRGIDVVATVSGTTNDATLTIRPRNTTLDWAGVTEVEGSWIGALTEASVSITSAATLSRADDTNRIGTTNQVTFLDSGYVSRTTPYGDLPIITFARGASLTLGNGFTMEVGLGYDWIGDAKDGLFKTENNSKIVFSGQPKENLWGGKFRVETGGLVQDAFLATDTNPMTVIQENSGSIVESIDSSINSPTFGQRTFLVGRASAQNNQSLQWIVNNSQTGFFKGKSNNFFYPVPGIKQRQTVVFDMPETGSTCIYEPSNTIKQFTGDSLVISSDNNSFQFNGGTVGSATAAENYTYASQWITGGMKLVGLEGTLGGNQPRNVNFTLFDLENSDGIYQGGWNFNTRSVGTTGIVALGRLWNPSWQYQGAPLTGLIESYYYGVGAEEATLVAVKEGCEPEDIGTVAANNHPLDDSVTISSTSGLADTTINGANINRYKSDNTGTSSGWGDTIDDYDGLMLVFTKGEKSLTTDGANTKLTTAQHATDWFCYSRRDGYRPRFITESFSGSLTAYQPATSMEPFLDPNWQSDTVDDIKVFTDKFSASLYSLVPVYNSGSLLLDLYLPESETWNQIYRFIEYSENNGNITGANLASEGRTFNTINGRFRRFIDNTLPVTIDGEINIPDFNLKITVDGDLTRSTQSNSIRGIDVGTTNTIDIHTAGGVPRVIKGDLTAKSFSFTETFGDLSAEDSTFNNTDDQTYSIALTNTTVNSLGSPTFSDVTSGVRVNTNSATIVSSPATDMIVNGTSDIAVSANTTDCTFGTISNKASSLDQSSGVISIGDNAQLSGNADLSDNVTDAIINAGGFIDRSGTGGIWTNCDLTSNGVFVSNSVSGGRVKCNDAVNVVGSLNTTTVEAVGLINISGNATDSSGIGINGSSITVGGNTSGCEVNSVTTFQTNDVTDGSDVSAGTSATVEDINDSKVVSPVVSCDRVENSATVDATTSLDVAFSMTGGTITSPSININVDFTGGTANASGTLTVPTISGAQTTANAGTLDTTTLTSGFVNLSGTGSTIDSINGGIINGNASGRTLTTINQITGGDFGSNITLLAVPTNTVTSQHLGNYADTSLEMTIAGKVEFGQNATGVAVITAGPSSGITRVVAGGLILTKDADDGTNNTDNVIIEENPFTITINYPSDGIGRVELPDGTISAETTFDEGDLDRGDTFKVGYIDKGFAIFYEEVTVENLFSNGTQVVNVNPIAQAYTNTSEVPTGTVVNSVSFTSNLLVIDVANVVQQAAIMNKLIIEGVMADVDTLSAVFHYSSADILGSDGTVLFINTDRVRLTSSTASNVGTKETMAFFRPSQSATNAEIEPDQYLLSSLDLALGQSVIQSTFTTAELDFSLNKRKLTEGSIKNAQLGVPVFGPDQ